MTATGLSIARAEAAMGIREPEAFDRYCDGDKVAWCAAAVLWCYREIGITIEHPDRDWNRWHLRAVWRLQRTLDALGLRTFAPVPGGLFVSMRGQTKLDPDTPNLLARGSPGHVGFVMHVHEHRPEWRSLEANIGDRWVSRLYHRPERSVLAFYRPPEFELPTVA